MTTVPKLVAQKAQGRKWNTKMSYRMGSLCYFFYLLADNFVTVYSVKCSTQHATVILHDLVFVVAGLSSGAGSGNEVIKNDLQPYLISDCQQIRNTKWQVHILHPLLLIKHILYFAQMLHVYLSPWIYLSHAHTHPFCFNMSYQTGSITGHLEILNEWSLFN